MLANVWESKSKKYFENLLFAEQTNQQNDNNLII